METPIQKMRSAVDSANKQVTENTRLSAQLRDLLTDQQFKELTDRIKEDPKPRIEKQPKH